MANPSASASASVSNMTAVDCHRGTVLFLGKWRDKEHVLKGKRHPVVVGYGGFGYNGGVRHTSLLLMVALFCGEISTKVA